MTFCAAFTLFHFRGGFTDEEEEGEEEAKEYVRLCILFHFVVGGKKKLFPLNSLRFSSERSEKCSYMYFCSFIRQFSRYALSTNSYASLFFFLSSPYN